MAKAVLFYHAKRAYADDTIIEIRIWKLPRPNEERPHGYKYSLSLADPANVLSAMTMNVARETISTSKGFNRLMSL